MARFALVVVAAVVMLAACSSLTVENPFNLAPVSVRLDEASAAAPVTIVRGQTLVVTLDANVTTGYRWEAMPGFAPVLLQVGTADYSGPTGPPNQAGAPGTMTFRFRAAELGKATLDLAYRRPFEANVAAAKTVRYDVTVR